MSRSRNRVTSINWVANRKLYDTNGNVTSSLGTSYTDSTRTELMTDNLTPGYFHKARRNLFLPVNSMTHEKYAKQFSQNMDILWRRNLQFSPYTFRGNAGFTGETAQAYHWGKTSTTWNAWTGPLPSWATDSSVTTDALANARTNGFDLLTFLAEWHKTVDLIRGFRERTLQRAERVSDAVSKAYSKPTKLRNAKRFANAVDGFSQTWLEGRYGWRILAYDIQGINQALQRLNAIHSELKRGYSQQSDSRTRTLYSTTVVTPCLLKVTPSDAGVSVPGTGYLKQDLVYTKRAGALLEAIATSFLTLDPLVTLNEVIPFSFIVDWFTNLGNLVAAYSPLATENLAGAWVSTKETLNTYSSFTPATGNIYASENQTWTLLSGSTATSSLVKETYSRYPTSPSASLSFRLNIDIAKITDLSAIFHGRYRKMLKGLTEISVLRKMDITD